MPVHRGNLDMTNVSYNANQGHSMQPAMANKPEANLNMNSHWDMLNMQQLNNDFMANNGLDDYLSNFTMRPIHETQNVNISEQEFQEQYSFDQIQPSRLEPPIDEDSLTNLLQ